MRYQHVETLGQVIKRYIEALKIGSKLQEVRLMNNWERILGTTISKATVNIYIHDRKLFVSINSSIIKNELFMFRTELVRRLNESVNANVIDVIIFR